MLPYNLMVIKVDQQDTIATLITIYTIEIICNDCNDVFSKAIINEMLMIQSIFCLLIWRIKFF